MKRGLLYFAAISVLTAFIQVNAILAETALNAQMQLLLNSYLTEAQQKEPGLKAFSAEEGKKIFHSKRIHSEKKEVRSCTTCHTNDAAQQGKTTVGKSIEPLSPAVSKERFTDPQKVEKWFKRNCEWTLERECTPKEKGDFITFMMSL